MPGSYSVEPATNADNQEARRDASQQVATPGQEAPDLSQPTPVVEISQTDRLNKRLLIAFLNRLNSQSTAADKDKINHQQQPADKSSDEEANESDSNN